MESNESQGTTLIVDDNPTNLEVLQELLVSQGYEVLISVDGASALAQAEYALPDMILLDVMMPGMDGFETCKYLKERETTRNIPVIFLTALSDSVDKVRGFELGAVDYITKPLQHHEVLARVQTHLKLNRLQRRLERVNEELEERVEARTAELRRLNAAYQKFVPNAFLDFLGKGSILDVELGDCVERRMTVFFTDVHGWTSISENLEHAQTLSLINEYYGLVSPLIRKRGGVVDKYLGDGVMALFPESPDHALDAAIQIHLELESDNRRRSTHGLPVFQLGAGIHTGDLAVGIIGESERMEGTVVSDNVNLASRIEGLTRTYGAPIVISESTLLELKEPERFHTRFLDKVKVKGRNQLISVFEVFDGLSGEEIEKKVATRATFERGIELYNARRFAEAGVQFNRTLGENPGDRAARIYLERSARNMVDAPPEDWDGAEVLNDK